MFKPLISIVFWLLSSAAFAAAREMEAASAPAETVDMVYVVLFGVAFIGMIVGFFVYLWMNERKKPEENQ